MLNPRLDDLKDYPFQRLRALLDGLDPPAGVTPIDLTLGEPRHPFPAFVADILAANQADYGRYPPLAGTAELRDAIAGWLKRRYALPDGMLDGDHHIVPLNGTREGLYMIAQVAVPPAKDGRQPAVLIPNPFYHSYVGAAVTAGAKPILMPTTAETGFLPDYAAVGDDVLRRTAMIYLCSPANPQGAVADADYLADLIALCRRHDILLLVDECYAEIYYDRPPTGALEVCARLGGDMANVLVFHSLSKRSNLPGLRSGFAAGDAAVVAPFLRLRSYGGATTPLPVMAAAAAAWRDEDHVETNRALYRAKFDIAIQKLSNRYGFRKPAGGFFLWLDVGDGIAATRTLWTEAGVRALPGAYLGRSVNGAAGGSDDEAGNPGTPFIRLALVDGPDVTAEALDRLCRVL
jgi:succinyldiaminopimelate transaminase